MPSVTQTTDEQRRNFAEALTLYLGRAGMRPADLIRALRDQGFAVHQASMSQWTNGVHEPTRPIVYAIERELDLVPGLLSRNLGYLPITAVDFAVSDVTTALLADHLLSPDQRQLLIATYRTLLGL